jgi:hypothetical protein
MPWKGTGTFTIQTSWSHHGKELISTSTFRTKNGKNAELIGARKLADSGNTLVLSQTLKIEGERQERVCALLIVFVHCEPLFSIST